jgi:hypothetical protein
MLQEFFQQYFGPVVVLIVLAIALTIFVFRKRKFERGPRKGVAANPQQVKKENRPDEWSQSH